MNKEKILSSVLILRRTLNNGCTKTCFRNIKINKRLYGLTSLVSLCVYLFFRNFNNMILFKFIPKPVFAKTVLIKLEPSIFSYVFKYNFPYMLWFLSGILLMRFIWFFNYKTQKIYVFLFMVLDLFMYFVRCQENFPEHLMYWI